MTAKTTYALLIYRTEPSEPAPAGSARALEGHRALQKQAAARGELHAVAKLDETSTARVVALRSGAHELRDGPYIETKEWLVGFYVVDCANEEAALEHARTICPLDDHVVEVRPVTWRWEP